jgi:hypothetical protein
MTRRHRDQLIRLALTDLTADELSALLRFCAAALLRDPLDHSFRSLAARIEGERARRDQPPLKVEG